MYPVHSISSPWLLVRNLFSFRVIPECLCVSRIRTLSNLPLSIHSLSIPSLLPSRMPPKPRLVPHNIVVLVIDVGEEMTPDEVNEAKKVADWIVARKVFTCSTDEVRIIVAGSEDATNAIDYPTVHVHDDVFQRASFDMLRYIHREIVPGKIRSQVSRALLVAIDTLREESDGRPDIEGRQIVLLSNGANSFRVSDPDSDSIVNAMKNDGIDFVAIGMDEPQGGGNALERLVMRLEKETDAQRMTFQEASHGIAHFSRPAKAKRGMPFLLEIGPNLKIPVKSYVKTKYNPKLNAVKYVHPEGNEEVKRERVFVQTFTKETVEDEDGDKKINNDIEVKTVDKMDVLKSFMFGKTRVTISEEELKDYSGAEFREGKCLQLVQCTKRSELNPSHLIGKETRVFVLDDRAEESSYRTFSSLLRALLSLDTVLLVRYAYSRVSSPHLLALFPYEEDNGSLALAGVRVAFYEDIRPLQFPPLADANTRPTSHQLRLIDDLIDGMMLTVEDGTEIDSELILQPSYQRICSAARMTALGIEEEENADDYLKALKPDEQLIEKVEGTLKEMTDEERGFPLFKEERVKRPRLERVPESIDDLLQSIEEKREEYERNLKEEPKPMKKLTFREKALVMKDVFDLIALRNQLDTVLDSSEGDEAFFPRIAQMLSQLREGARKASLTVQFDSLLQETRDAFYLFAIWMNEQPDDHKVFPLSESNTAFWSDNKDIKPF